MSNSFGRLFRYTTWGESHGPAIGCVVDGVPAGVALNENDIQPALDKRKPGTSKYTTQRREEDLVSIKSGVFEGLTTGTSLALEITNGDQRSKDYGEIKNAFRPGHADYTYWEKYGLRDYRGGGRASARETAMRVAAGAVAQKVIDSMLGNKTVSIQAAMVQMGPHKIDRSKWDWEHANQNPFFCPDADTAEVWATYLDGVRKSGSSCGAVIEVIASNVPAGLGEPVYGKIDTDIAAALMSINAVKGVEIGDGFDTAAYSGEENADEMRLDEAGNPHFTSNHAGGVLGGISSGQDVVARFVVKPTSSILTQRDTLNRFGEELELRTKGRHDPCVGIRAVPVAEAMMAIVIADHLMLAAAKNQSFEPRPWDVRD
ncbi:MAG: chorismate synthase [Alphaproteobacteria bacterium]